MSEKADIIQGEFAKIFDDISRFADRYNEIESLILKVKTLES